MCVGGGEEGGVFTFRGYIYRVYCSLEMITYFVRKKNDMTEALFINTDASQLVS